MALRKDLLFALWLGLLVLTGGASHPLRLAVLALPLAIALPGALPLIGAGFLLAVPSVLELSLHGDWIGPLGARIRLVAGGVVAASAFCLGLAIRRNRHLRRQCLPFIPVVCILLLVQALLGLLEILPPTLRFLNGNHLAALALLLLAPALSMGLDSRSRGLSLAALGLVLLFSTSRWGSVVGVSAAMLIIAREQLSGHRKSLCIATALMIPVGLWGLRDHFELSKLSTIAGLFPIAELRPWTGVGPEGLERLSLQFIMSFWGRMTHAENLYLDWATSLGIPMAMLLMTTWLGWCLWRLDGDGERTTDRMRRSSALVLLFLLVHELLDFSLTSGAVASMAGFLFAWTAPQSSQEARTSSSVSTWFGACLTLTLPLLAWQFEPLRLERNGSLETMDPRWGQHPYRIAWKKARATEAPEARIPLLAKALEQAPGEGLLWLDFGDALYQSRKRTQAREAYRHGFSLLQDASRRRRGSALAQTLEPEEVWQVLRPKSQAETSNQVPAMVGATPVILTKGAAGYAVVRRAEQTFRNKELSRLYLQALKRPGLHPALVIEESLRLLRRKPPTPEAGALLVSTIASHHGLDAALEAQRRVIESLPVVGCQALGQWPLESIERLIPYRTQFLRICGDLPTKDLHTDHVLSRIPRPVLE